MMALRTTRPDTSRRPRFLRELAVLLSVVLVGLTGCSGGSKDGRADAQNPAPYRPMMVQLPAPAPDRIVYKSGTLTVYDLPASGRWMMQRNGAPHAYPIGPQHTLPEGLDAENTFVYYCRPGGQQSGHVSLAQILAAGREHDSQLAAR